MGGGGGTMGSDVTLENVGVFINVLCRTMHVSYELALNQFLENSRTIEKAGLPIFLTPDVPYLILPNVFLPKFGR